MNPRNTLPSTRAQGQLQRNFFKEYLHARTLNGADREIESAFEVFEGQTLETLKRGLSSHALSTSVTLTDRLSDRVLAIHTLSDSGATGILVNTRFKVDPEILLHTLIEEYVHAQQVLDGVDFEDQRQQFSTYYDRPYEQEAKRIASEILGYKPDEYVAYLLREEPIDPLYDRPAL